MTGDAELLRRYALDHSQAAFAELVQRHLPLVYAAALRQTNGAAHRAEDIAQSVFIDLARKARLLTGRDNLVGWLHTGVHHAAAQLKRTEQRRERREHEAHTMQHLNSPETPPVDWEQLRPVIDDALQDLPERDRQVLLLRFFQGLPFADLGRRVGLSEDAARMRVERALDKLRVGLARRDITSTSAALGAVLLHQPAVAVPAGLAAKITGTALATSSAAGLTATLLEILMHTIKSNLLLGGSIAAATAIVAAWQHQANAATRAEIDRLHDANRTLVSLTADNVRLAERAAATENLRRAAANLPALRADAALTAALALPVHPTVTVTRQSTIFWDAQPITLDEFVQRLRQLGQ
ncbi:MAG TPA: sigma-70 family RNA polymerase sigma factor [Acidobacteriota bacterium]|nr:sigma-70 family RNA polymerase sigma factor [Acidobacteriota bacterium]